MSRHYDDALEGVGINVAQFSLLRFVRRLDNPSISSLADAMGLDRSTLGRNVKVLEAEGLLALAEGRDLRNRLVVLTEQGKACLRDAEPAWQAAQASLVEKLGQSQRDQLVSLLEQLA